MERGTGIGCASGTNDMRLQHEEWKLASLLLGSIRLIDTGVPNYCKNITGMELCLDYAFYY